MIKVVHDNILVTELHKDSTAGALLVNQDESSPYMFVHIESISDESKEGLGLDDMFIDDILLVIRRTAKLPFVKNEFFISYKDVVAIISRKDFEEI